jgi:hypothetical protein
MVHSAPSHKVQVMFAATTYCPRSATREVFFGVVGNFLVELPAFPYIDIDLGTRSSLFGAFLL